MKINNDFINKIFNNKINLTNNKDKILLSSYQDLIPMYDIYTQQIYPIEKEYIYSKLNDSHYRFINYEIKKWITQQYEKYKIKIKKVKGDEKQQMEELILRLEKMLKIIDNYDIDKLIDTSYKVLYKYGTLGVKISICKRNSFHPFIFYLKPYYTKIELIKLGQNMGINKFKVDDLIDEEKHYSICKNISNNDVSFDEIKSDTLKIINNNTISDICFYSFIGASLLNNFLRNQSENKINKFFYDRLTSIVNTIKNASLLEKDYQIYRFIDNDEFIKDLKIGETFIDSGFTSTTRDPFYSPGLNGNFGLILIKINLKKNIKGEGAFIEHFSLFPTEEEYLLPPNTKLKLISKDDKFKYYHVNSNFEKIIYKKYEFELIKNDYSWLSKINVIDEDIPIFVSDNITGNNKLDLFNSFKNLANSFYQIQINDYVFTLFYFDSTTSYSKFYYNKIEKGLSLIYFDKNGYPLINIEMGKEMVVNYINQYYFYNEKEEFNEKHLLEILLKLGEIFNYKKAIIFNTFNNYNKFKNNYYVNHQMFLYLNHYDNTLYNYIKNNIKPFSFEMFYENKFKDIDIILNKNNSKQKLINIIEKEFNNYDNYIKELELDKLNYGVFNIYDKLLSEGKTNITMNLDYSNDLNFDNNLELIYRQPIRRGN
jgi:hypothetical protein